MTENTVAVVKVNKSKLVLEAFKKMGIDTPANDIIDDIKQNSNVDVTVSLVNTLRFKERNKRAERSAKRKQAAQKKAEAQPMSDLNKLLVVKKFAAEMGGLDTLKALIADLERFQAEMQAA